jgi:putative ABC transport system permease protein
VLARGERGQAAWTDNLNLPGLTNASSGVQVTAYGGDPAWSGLVLIKGRWYSQAAGVAEIDVNTLFLTDTSLSVGDTYTMVNGGHRVTAKIVGEVFAAGNDVTVFMSPATLAAIDPATSGAGQHGVSLKPGVSADSYATSLSAALGSGYLVGTHSADKALIAITTLISMVVCSVAATGLAAGIIAVPAGIALHRNVLPVMAHAANSDLPGSVGAVFSPPEMIGLALAGLVIAVAGGLAPAFWAARSRTATALRTE